MEIERAVDVAIRGQGRARRIGELAARQHGVVSRAQLIALGLSHQAIDRLLAGGQLHLLHRGVYAWGHTALTQRSRWMAATLAGRGVLSHRSAAALWRMVRWTGALEVRAVTRRHSQPGLTFRHGRLEPDEITVLDGIPVTTPHRTLLDLAAVLSPDRLARAIDEAEVLRLTDAVPLATLLDRHRGARGVATLRVILNGREEGASVTRSELEDDFLSFIEKFDLPRPQTNVIVHGHEVDGLWPEHRLVAELDGHAVHATRRSFEQDRRRDRVLAVRGHRVVRITWEQIHHEPAELAADLRRLLEPSLARAI